MERQIELETLAVIIGIAGYKGSSYTLQEEVNQLWHKLQLLKAGAIKSDEYAVYMLESTEFAKNQM